MTVLYACSSNPGKLREFVFSARHSGFDGFDVQALPGLRAIAPPAEDGATYEENAELKARYYSGFNEALVFADDSGLEVAALDGAPGVHSARFAGPAATAQQNSALLLKKLAGVTARQARFVTAISLAQHGNVLQTLRGAAEGEILLTPKGGLGFGYDPLFFFPPLQRTFAELSDSEKFAVSARGEAFRQLVRWLAFR